MGQAREIMDRVTAAVRAGDTDALGRLYAEDAVADTPDEGRLEGRAAVVDYLMKFARAFPDVSFELEYLEAGDTAIDLGYFTGTNTGPLPAPDGGELPPTGRTVRIRECDVLTAANGVATVHRFYFDQLDLLAQLGLIDPASLGSQSQPT